MNKRILAAVLLVVAGRSVAAGPELDDARQAYERGHYAVAHAKLLVAARDGDASAQELLGFMYAFGPHLYPSVPRDLKMAARWFARAANNGRPLAHYMLCALARREARKPQGLRCFQETPVSTVASESKSP